MHWIGYTCLTCEKTQSRDFAGYTCPSCHGNLDVTYDYTALRKKVAAHQIFGGERQDIFKYAALLPISKLDLAPPLRIGSTPLYPARRLGESIGLPNLYLKDDGLNPSGSFKDRASAIAITRARELGATVVAGASTGNAGSSMACMAASVGQPCVVFVPEKAPAAKIAQLMIFGARVLAVRGTYDQAFDLCMEVCAKTGWFNRNTGYNPFTREGKKTGSFELCDQLGWKAPDRVVVAVGDGNIISGLWKGMKDLHAVGLIDRLPKIDCAQSSASAAISRAVQQFKKSGRDPRQTDWSQIHIEPVQATTIADSISVDLPRDGIAGLRAVVESGGEAVTVDDREIIAAIPELARGAGVFVEPSSATVWACIKKMAKEGLAGKNERVVGFLTGNGLKDVARAREATGAPIVIDANPAAALIAVQDLV